MYWHAVMTLIIHGYHLNNPTVIQYYGVLMDCQRRGWPLLQLRHRDCIIDFQAFTLPNTLLFVQLYCI